MNYLIFVYKWSARDLRKVIVAILKSWLCDNVKKINYVQDFLLNWGNVNKTEQKIIMVHTEDSDKLMDFLSKNFPQIGRITIA